MTALVSLPEANLLTLARAAVGVVPASEMTRLLVASVPSPPKLGPTARRLLSDTLARGAVLALARSGGWHEAQGGRLWERYQPPGLEFGPNLVRLLQWVLRTPLTEVDAAPLVLHEALTPAEELVAALLFERAKGTACELTLARQPALRASPLVVLMHAAEFGRAGQAGAPFEVPRLRLADHAPLIDGLRDVLARAWVDAERAKQDTERPDELIRVGRAQEAVLQELFEVAGELKHHGLVSFVVDAGVTWFARTRGLDDYVRSLNPDTPLSKRGEARYKAAAFLRALASLRAWDQRHRATRFIEDDYQVAQHLVRAWEPLGDRGFRDAERLVAELEALPT